MTLFIELAAAAFGVLGTVLLALNGPRAGWGFVAYLVSNAGWIAFAWMHAHWGLLAQQIAFTASSLLGAYVWLWRPRKPAVWTPDQVMAACEAMFDCKSRLMVDKMCAALTAADRKRAQR